MDWIVMTEAEKDAASLLDDADSRLGARRIDNPEAGERLGLWAAPARLLSDPDYARWGEMLGDLPVVEADGGTLFLSTDA